VLGQSDTGNLLTALGINGFFSGYGGGNIAVSEHIATNLDNIAASKATPPGDNANAVLLAEIKQERVCAGGTETLNEYYASTVGRAGIETSQAIRSEETQTKLVENLERQRESIAGVSLEEEMAKLMQNQQAYQAAVRLIQSIDQMLSALTQL
jgi:flagellar hook-associated protein 1 FlgK